MSVLDGKILSRTVAPDTGVNPMHFHVHLGHHSLRLSLLVPHSTARVHFYTDSQIAHLHDKHNDGTAPVS